MKVVDKFHYYVVFSKPILFISGLIFSYSMVGSSVFSILIVHLTDWMKNDTLPKHAKVVNIHQGSYEVLQIFFAYVADAYSGLFPMLLFSTPIYIIGLWLCYIATRRGVFYIALVLVTLSQAAKKVTLKAFLGDQLLAMDRPTTEEEEERANCRSMLWWNLVTLLASVAAFFVSMNIDSFKLLSLISAIAMCVGFSWFLLGTKLYARNKPTSSPLADVVFVIYAAIRNRNVQYPEQIFPHVSWLRWLDRAAIMVQDQEKPGRFCSVEQVKGVKFLLKMLPLWTTFLTFSLIEATGSTFFLEEATNINDDFPVLFFIILEKFTEFVVSAISNYVTDKLVKKNNKIGQRMMLLRIGIGMISCVLCCILAWINAHHWFHSLKKYSVFRLVPQYLLLGIMEGLSEDGLENFFDSQVSTSISRYGPPFGECVMGIGKFLSVFCILFFSKRFQWIKDDIDSSRLDKYYAMLTVLSSVNLIIFWILAYWYGDERFFSEDQVDSGDNYFDFVQTLVEAESGFRYTATENAGAQQSQPQEDSMPLLNIETEQERNVSSSSVLPNNDTERPNNSRDQVTPLVSETLRNRRSDVLLQPNGVQSFPRPSSKGIQKRFHSMH